MLINLRNALMAGKRLPYDAEVEYLESTGDQYINTGVTPVDDATFVICAAFTDLTTGRFGAVQLVSVGGATSRYYFGVSNGKFIGAINSVSYNHNISQADTGIHIFKTNSLGLYIDDVMVVAAENSKPTIPVYLANIDGSTSAIPTKAKLYSCKIYDANGVLVRDYIPVRKGTTGELYDRVSGKLAERDGYFVVGQDVVPVEYIESHGTEYIDTGYYLNNNCRAEFDGYITSTPTWFSGFFGSRVNASSLNIAVSSNNNGSDFGRCDADFSNGSFETYRASILSFSAPVDFYADISASRRYIRVGSAEASNDTPNTDVFTSAYTCKLFKADNIGAGNQNNKSRCRRFSIWDNSALVRKFLPVHVGTEGAMMDVLTRRIYRNAGTGAFTYGNDLKYPIPAS